MYQRDGNAAVKKDLNNTMALCKLLDNPEKKFKSIHIAGTNGKGSTAHMMASIFQEAGYKTGLYTSPHMKDFRERIKINGEMISQEKVVRFVETNRINFEGIHPSFFEWTVALAFDYFAEEEVDIAIIETGLGGRLDSTNVIEPILSVITNIDWDHMDMLGDTLEKIAAEKAGIIKRAIPVVIGNRSGVEEIFIQKAKSESAELTFAEDLNMPLILGADLKGKYQNENLRTVFAAWLQLRKLSSERIEISYTHFLRGVLNTVENTHLRGRWETLSENPKIIADVAHNEAGLKFVMQQLKEEKYENLHFVLGVVKEKDIHKMLGLLPKKATYYFCAANISRSLNSNQLRDFANERGLNGGEYGSVELAIQAAKSNASTQDLIYIGGSTFVVAEAL